jgi:hypothetical protein
LRPFARNGKPDPPLLWGEAAAKIEKEEREPRSLLARVGGVTFPSDSTPVATR